MRNHNLSFGDKALAANQSMPRVRQAASRKRSARTRAANRLTRVRLAQRGSLGALRRVSRHRGWLRCNVSTPGCLLAQQCCYVHEPPQPVVLGCDRGDARSCARGRLATHGSPRCGGVFPRVVYLATYSCGCLEHTSPLRTGSTASAGSETKKRALRLVFSRVGC